MESRNNFISDVYFTPGENEAHAYVAVSEDNFSLESKKFGKVKDAIKEGKIYTSISKIFKPSKSFFAYKLLTCIGEGDSGDESGFGVEPDTWAQAYVDTDGNYLMPFCIIDEALFREYWKKVMMQIYHSEYIYEFTSKEMTDVIIQHYYGEEAHVIVPESICGRPVKKIGERAFYNNNFVESVTIAKGIEEIGNSAFAFCENLKQVILPDSVKLIGKHVFRCCEKLKDSIRI